MAIILKPIVTEKMTAAGEKLNRYGFRVERAANKVQIKKAVEECTNVQVVDCKHPDVAPSETTLTRRSASRAQQAYKGYCYMKEGIQSI